MEITNRKQRIQTPLQWITTTSHFLMLLTKIFLPFSLLSVILSYAFSCNFQALAYGLQLFSFSVDKNYMFLLCNGLLVFIATSSGLIGSSCVETDVKAQKAVKMSKFEVEASEPKGSNLKPKVVAEFDQREEEEDLPLVVENEGEEDRSNELVSMEGDEDEELGWMSNEELNKKCEEFIRKMKDGIEFEARQVIMVQ